MVALGSVITEVPTGGAGGRNCTEIDGIARGQSRCEVKIALTCNVM